MKNDDVYPLENDVFKRLTTLQKIQIFLMTITIVPIRILLMALVLAIVWPLSIIVTKNQSENMQKQPLSGWRRSMYPLVRMVSRSLYFVGGFHWIKVYGKRDETVRILTVAPHSSYLDSLFIVYMNFISIIARLGSDEVLLFGNLTKMCHPILVNREKQQSRSDTVTSLIERANDPKWPQICIYPEGTCTNRKALVQFKTGAFIPGLPVQPVCVKFPQNDFDSVSWTWEGPDAFKVIWLTLCKLHSPAEIHFLPVYNPNEDEIKDPVLYAENVRKLMAEYLQVPMSDYSYEDGILIKNLTKNGIPREAGLVKIQKLRKKLGISEMDEVLKLIPIYSKIADKKSGLCFVGKFEDYLSLKSNELSSKLFSLFDQNGVGNFDFKNFICTYFEKMNPILKTSNRDKLVKKILDSLDRFKSEDEIYELDELNLELRQKFNIELSKFDDPQITKELFGKFLNDNLLHLYLFNQEIKQSI